MLRFGGEGRFPGGRHRYLLFRVHGLLFVGVSQDPSLNVVCRGRQVIVQRRDSDSAMCVLRRGIGADGMRQVVVCRRLSCCGRGIGGERVALHAAVFLQADECARAAAVVVIDGERVVTIDADVQRIAAAAGVQVLWGEAGRFVVELVVGACDRVEGERCGGVEFVEVEGVAAAVFEDEDEGDGMGHGCCGLFLWFTGCRSGVCWWLAWATGVCLSTSLAIVRGWGFCNVGSGIGAPRGVVTRR